MVYKSQLDNMFEMMGRFWKIFYTTKFYNNKKNGENKNHAVLLKNQYDNTPLTLKEYVVQCPQTVNLSLSWILFYYTLDPLEESYLIIFFGKMKNKKIIFHNF